MQCSINRTKVSVQDRQVTTLKRIIHSSLATLLQLMQKELVSDMGFRHISTKSLKAISHNRR